MEELIKAKNEENAVMIYSKSWCPYVPRAPLDASNHPQFSNTVESLVYTIIHPSYHIPQCARSCGATLSAALGWQHCSCQLALSRCKVTLYYFQRKHLSVVHF